MARKGSIAFLLISWSIVLCLAVHESQDASSLDAESLGEAAGEASGVAMAIAAGAKGQPIISRGDKNKCVHAESLNSIKAGNCKDAQSKFYFNRLNGGQLVTMGGAACLTRKKGSSEVSLSKCTEGNEDQVWQRLCGAWANGDAKAGRVLEISGNKIKAAKWTGEENQLWDYKEVGAHTKCSKKRYKVMKFSGTSETAVRMQKFLSFPKKLITVSVWIKRTTKGTLFSYATKHHIKAFVLKNSKSLDVYIKDHKVSTQLDLTSREWVHVGVTWNSDSGLLVVYKDGVKAFSKKNVQRGKEITPGGTLVLGQEQQKVGGGFTDSFDGLMTDFQIWKQEAGLYDIHKMSVEPVEKAVLKKIGKDSAPQTPENQRVAFLTRQYSEEETKVANPPVCDLDAFKEKKVEKIPHVHGNMRRLSGTGDVHYMNFHHCRFDDQSVGEWVAAQTQPKWWKAAPMQLQFRTSPSRTNCPWCQNGAVSYIDGCAIKYKDEQASAGFGGYGFGGSYTPYAAMNGQRLNGHRRSKELSVTAYRHRFNAVILSEGVRMDCYRQAIYITMPNKFKGKIWGLGGTGEGGHRDWQQGPNTKANPQAKLGQMQPGLGHSCHRRWQYTIPHSPFNGNHPNKPLVKWFKSWQVDGDLIPSAFYYNNGQGPGSFNRVAGQRIKPVSNTNKRPSGTRKAAEQECKLLRDTPKAREKCVFDFMMLGRDAIEGSRKDREKQRVSKVKKPTHRSIRDISRYRNDGDWTSHIGWECARGFRRMQFRKRTAYHKARSARIAKAKELAEKAELKRRREHADKNGPCPSGWKTNYHPEVFGEAEVSANKKQCMAGMVPVAAKARSSHYGSGKKALSVVTTAWMKGSDDEGKEARLGESNTQKPKSDGIKRSNLENPDPVIASAGGDVVIAGSNQPEEAELGEDNTIVSHKAPAKEIIESNAISLIQEQGAQQSSISGWGEEETGGDTKSVEKVKDIVALAGTSAAFAAITREGNVVAWGKPSKGGDISKVKNDLNRIDSVYATSGAFAALQAETGKVITWGDSSLGGNSERVKTQLSKGVNTVTGTEQAFAAVAEYGKKIVSWGTAKYGGDSSKIQKDVEGASGIKSISATGYAFAALTTSRRRSKVLTWGARSLGGHYSEAVKRNLKDVKQVFANKYAFAALTDHGDVITWGHNGRGGNSAAVASQLKNVVSIASTDRAFAALTGAGKVITWGEHDKGGDSRRVRQYISQGIKAVYGTANGAFAALSHGGVVYTWGYSRAGGNPRIKNNIVSVAASADSFSLVTKDGEVEHLNPPPPPPRPGHCHYVDRSKGICTDTGLNRCGGFPLWNWHNRHKYVGVYAYMDRWNHYSHASSGCGFHWWYPWHGCHAGIYHDNRYALCASADGQQGTGGQYLQTHNGWRYYKVKVAGVMSSDNINRACTLHGYVTPCTGPGGKPYVKALKPVPAEVKNLQATYANKKSFVGLVEPLSTLCHTRYGSDGRFDARCNDGWQQERKSAVPICEDENTNKNLPCSMLAKSCTKDAVQAACAKTCGTYEKGSEECKKIAAARNQYKCVRSYSCDLKPTASSPDGMHWVSLKGFGRPRDSQHGCGAQARVEMAGCSKDAHAVSCSCSSAYTLDSRSITTSDCGQGDYEQESKAILDRLVQHQDQTAQWMHTCTSIEKGAKAYATNTPGLPELAMMSGNSLVWKTKAVHSKTLSMKEDGCEGEFIMSLAICNTPPFKQMTVPVPLSGDHVIEVGCGCQEIIARASYRGKLVSMKNKMPATRSMCVKHFSQWTLDFQRDYFFGGLGYQAKAIELSKQVRQQCVDAGVKPSPQSASQKRAQAVEQAMKQNQKTIRAYEKQVYEASMRVLKVRKEKHQCIANLPKGKDNYDQLNAQLSIEPDQKEATELKSEVDDLRKTLNTKDKNDAALKAAEEKAAAAQNSTKIA